MLRILLNESLSSDAFEGAPSKKAFWRSTTSHVHPINKVNLTEPGRNCFDLDKLGWSPAEQRRADVSLPPPPSPLLFTSRLGRGAAIFLIGFTAELRGQ